MGYSSATRQTVRCSLASRVVQSTRKRWAVRLVPSLDKQQLWSRLPRSLRRGQYRLTESLLGDRLDLAHIVEYPKCGGTWLRRLVETYRDVPTTTQYGRLLTAGSVIQRHTLPKRFIHNPVIIVRDPRDMLVSFFYHDTRVVPFLAGESVPPIPEDFGQVQTSFTEYVIDRYSTKRFPGYTFSDFLRRWQERKDVAWVKYEDMLDDTGAQLTKVLEHLGDEIDPDRVAMAVEANSFSKVAQAQAQERAGGVAFLRSGKAGDWQRHMTPAAASTIQKYEEYAIESLGYEQSSDWIVG